MSCRNSPRNTTTGGSCRPGQRDACVPCRRAFELDEQIERNRQEFESLMEQRRALLSCVNDHHDVLQTRLPIEIVSNIFTECRPIVPEAHYSETQYDETTFVEEVLNLGHVCRSWRQVAHSTPQLWTIMVASVTELNCERMVPLVSQWVERSRQLPLFIQLNLDLGEEVQRLGDSSNQPLLLNVHRLLGSIIEHAERWETLDISLPSTISAWVSTALANKTLARLSVLKTFVLWEDTQILQLEASPTIWCDTTCMLTPTSINQDRLTHFTADCLSFQELLDFLRNAPQINFVNVKETEGDPWSISAQEEPLLAPFLHTFIVRQFSNHYFRFLNFPALHTLHMDDSYYSEEDHDEILGWWTPIASFIQRSGCKLKELKIEESEQDGRGVGTFLSFTPGLEVLVFEGELLHTAFLEELTKALTSPPPTESATQPFLPQLKRLHCLAPDAYFDWTYLVALLEDMTSRTNSTLRVFRFQYTACIEDSVSESIKLNKLLFRRLMYVADSMDFRIVDVDGEDLVNDLRYLYA